MRSIKMLGLALVAMSAFFAVVASSASAKEPAFYSGLPAVEVAATLLIVTLTKNVVAGTENYLETTLAGTKVKVSCPHKHGHAFITIDAGGTELIKPTVIDELFCKVEQPSVTGCEVKSPGEANETIDWESGVTDRVGWAESSGEKAVSVLTGAGTKEEFAVLEFTTACKLPLGVTKVNLKGQVAANWLPSAVMSEMAELEFPLTAITKYFTGSAPGTEVKLKALEVEAVGGLAKAPAVYFTTEFVLLAPGVLQWLGLLAAGGMGTR